jgi:hypothetical protein
MSERRWFTVSNRAYFVVWEGSKGRFIRATDKSWVQRGHIKVLNAEMRHYGLTEEISEEVALKCLRDKGLPLPPMIASMEDNGMKEYYYNNGEFDTGYTTYKIEGSDTYYADSWGTWTMSSHPPDVIRDKMVRVSTLKEAKNGPKLTAFDTAQNTLIAAVAQSKSALHSTNIDVADRLQQLLRREKQIGVKIESFRREQVTLRVVSEPETDTRPKLFNP